MRKARRTRSSATVALAASTAGLALIAGHPVAEAAVPVPNDPNFPKQWNLRLIQIPEAWSVSRGDGVTVAVLDSGVAYEDFGPYRRAPDLAGTRFVAGKDLIDGDDHPNDDVDPATLNRPGHGTHSAGIIAQTTDNGLGQAAVAPGVALMPVRVLGPGGEGTDEQIAAGITFAVDHGAQVLNMSFDSPTDRPGTRAAVAYAASRGVTMVAAVGNTGRGPVGYPAAYPEVIAVGAVRVDKARARYSSFGALGEVDVMAPGGDLSVDQDGDGAPDGILSNSMVYGTNSFGDVPVEGTSAAAPHVAGIAALLIGSGLATTPAQVRRALESSALDLGPPGPDLFHGAGLVQARAALTAAGAPPPAREDGPAPGSPARPPDPASSPRRARWAVLGGAAGIVLAAGAGTALLRRRKSR